MAAAAFAAASALAPPLAWAPADTPPLDLAALAGLALEPGAAALPAEIEAPPSCLGLGLGLRLG